MAGGRDTKSRAQRIDLHYLSRSHWLRSGRVWLGLVALGLAGLWIAWHAFRTNPLPASPGPVSVAHRMIAERCETCHTDPVKKTGSLGVTDSACEHCHRVPDHQRSDDRKNCAGCHVEHRGTAELAQVATAHCTECHRDLGKWKELALVDAEAMKITTFDAGSVTSHPEFRIGGPGMNPRARPRNGETLSDASQQIQFSHERHLSSNLCGPQGRERLECTSCHQEPLASRKPLGRTEPKFAPAEEPQYFMPIRYEDHCARCHPHAFDLRIEPAPHDTPYVVRRFLEGAYARLARLDRKVIEGTPQVRPMPDCERAVATSASTPEAWAAEEVERAENLLFRRPCEETDPNDQRSCAERTRCLRCVECHYLKDQCGPDPDVIRPAIPTRWLPHSRFDHGLHRELKCTECHADATTSTKADGILMPRIATCRRCHQSETAAASTRCAECHTYHGAMEPKDLNGTRTIDEITGSSDGGGT